MLTVLLTTGLIFERQSKQRVPTLCFDMKFWSKHRVATPGFNHLPKISHVMKVASKCINRILNIRGRGSFGGRQLTIWQNFLKIHTRSREFDLCVAPHPEQQMLDMLKDLYSLNQYSIFGECKIVFWCVVDISFLWKIFGVGACVLFGLW